MTVKGIDVSEFQGSIDFEKAKKQIDFVIVRAGYGRLPSQKDKFFEENYKNAKAAGLKVGAYWFSYADSAEDAKREAKACIEVIKGKKFEYPVYFDIERKEQFDKGKEFCSDLVTAFCTELEKAGYFTGFYISRSPLQSFITPEVAKRYALWVAEYGEKLNYDGQYGMWQYTSGGEVDGISGRVDLDYCYVDYPERIAGMADKEPQPEPSKPKPTETVYTVKAGDTLSGIASKYKTTYQKLAEYNGINDPNVIYAGQKIRIPGGGNSALKPIDEIAREVIRGDWGNGDERKQRLTAAGYDYGKVQARVDELLR